MRPGSWAKGSPPTARKGAAGAGPLIAGTSTPRREAESPTDLARERAGELVKLAEELER